MRRHEVEELRNCSRPGRQNAYMWGCDDPEGSSRLLSGGMERRWNGPAAKAICWTEVRKAWANKKIVLFELFGWATYVKLIHPDKSTIRHANVPVQPVPHCTQRLWASRHLSRHHLDLPPVLPNNGAPRSRTPRCTFPTNYPDRVPNISLSRGKTVSYMHGERAICLVRQCHTWLGEHVRMGMSHWE